MSYTLILGCDLPSIVYILDSSFDTKVVIDKHNFCVTFWIVLVRNLYSYSLIFNLEE